MNLKSKVVSARLLREEVVGGGWEIGVEGRLLLTMQSYLTKKHGRKIGTQKQCEEIQFCMAGPALLGSSVLSGHSAISHLPI